jgi:TolB-like protein/Flp pilus assembly protein TadD
MNFFAELKRRHIYRVAAAYAVVAWVLLQLVNNVAPVLDLPVWVARALLLALVIGFPVALFFAWMRELAHADGATRAATGKFDWCLMGALVAVIALVSYQQLAPVTGSRTAQQAGIVNGSAGTDGISVAVLPFVNLSSDKEQEFFSDGMTEEITSALAKIPSLRVVARTSAFEFKGQNRNVQSIGQALHATHIIEGSVRKDGNEVRITAQLIKADDGTDLWTESYNRELKGVFAIQEEIAQAIAASLRVPLGLKAGETLVSNRTGDTESYQDYLRAKALVRARGLESLTEAAKLLEQVVARDQNYAPAWALLAETYQLLPNYDPAFYSGSVEALRRTVQDSLPKAEEAARKATALDANSAEAYVALGQVLDKAESHAQAEDAFKRALALDPNNPEALYWFSQTLYGAGRLKEALAVKQRLHTLEPFVPVFNWNLAAVLTANGMPEAAAAILKDIPLKDLPPTASNTIRRYLALAYASQGRFKEAADALTKISRGAYPERMVADAMRLLRSAPAKTASPQDLPPLGTFEFVYLYVGAPDRILELYEGNHEAGYGVSNVSLWLKAAAPVRKTERFKALMRNIGFVAYWRAKGWPDLCHPTTGDDFECI